MAKYEKVADLNHLNALIDADKHDFFILLNFGLRSSKYISRGVEEGTYFITNEIDDTEQVLTAEQMFDESLTNIGKAIKRGAFFSYGE